jgi:hypothetical protein
VGEGALVEARRGGDRATLSLQTPGSGAGEGVRFSTVKSEFRTERLGDLGRVKVERLVVGRVFKRMLMFLEAQVMGWLKC